MLNLGQSLAIESFGKFWDSYIIQTVEYEAFILWKLNDFKTR